MQLKRHFSADVALLSATLIWGTTFVIVRDILDYWPPIAYLMFRMSLAAIILITVLAKSLKSVTRAEIRAGVLLGVILSSGYAAQAIGQVYTTTTRSAFLTGLATPLVPIVSLILLRLNPTTENLVGVVLATVGGLLMFTPDSGRSINIGDIITLGCAVLFALHITLACYYAKRCDTHRLTALQITTAAVCLAVLWTAIQVYLYFLNGNATNILMGGEARRLEWNWRVSWEVVYLAIFGTVVTYFLWTWGQSRRSPTHVAIIFSLHPVFAALIAVGFRGLTEWMGTRASIGAGLIFVSVAISQLRFSNKRTSSVSGGID